jgi:GT2 family glycosyltransferase
MNRERVGVVVVPYFTSDLHVALAIESTSTLKSTHELHTIAIVNKIRGIPPELDWLKQFSVVEYNDRNNLSRAFNKGIRRALADGCRYVIVMNLDVTLHERTVDALVEYARAHPEPIVWSARLCETSEEMEKSLSSTKPLPDMHWSFFMVDARLLNEVGEFDEQFDPAYYEDIDMAYRIKLQGLKCEVVPDAPFAHYHMGTFKGEAAGGLSEADLGKKIETIVSNNLTRYITKWGGQPQQETVRAGPRR